MRLPRLALLAFAVSACTPVGAQVDAGQLSSPRATHASVVLDDSRVLLLGGCVRDGCEVGPDSATVDLFDRKTNRVSRAGRLLAPRLSPKAALLPDGRILIVGGWRDGAASSGAEIFDPASGRSQAAPSMSATRGDVSIAALSDGRILVVGGNSGRQRLAGAEVFDPASGSFTTVGPLRQARSDAQAVLLADGRVLVVGGATTGPKGTTPLSSAEIFDPTTGRFTPTGAMTEARHKHAALRLADGRVLVIAGSDDRGRDGKKQTLEIYDSARGSFVPGGTLHHERYKLTDAAVLLDDGRVLIAGGARYPEVYDPASGKSELLSTDLERPWNFMTAAKLGDGQVLLAGGYSERGLEVSDRIWLLAL